MYIFVFFILYLRLKQLYVCLTVWLCKLQDIHLVQQFEVIKLDHSFLSRTMKNENKAPSSREALTGIHSVSHKAGE